MSRNLLHNINLTLFGGLQTHFLRFLEYSKSMYGYKNAAWLEAPRLHPAAVADLRRGTHMAGHPKYIGGMKIPGWPKSLRAARERWLFDAAAADTGIIWDGFSRLQVAREMRAHGLRCLYWEHGASWYSHHRVAKVEQFWPLLDGIFCNSNAARRMLQLRWDCPMTVDVCLNGVASSLRSRKAKVRELPTRRPVRFGTAGHLRTYKGAHIAIAAIAKLRQRGVEAELCIAGTGPKQPQMQALAERLGVQDNIHFYGFVSDMQSFYDELDCYVHPAMREAFGLVCAEAMLAGCPVIATEVDGLPEVVTHGQTGLCVAPRRAAAELAELDTELEDRVDCVYDPRTDSVIEPRFIDPSDLADAMAAVATQQDQLATYSRNAIEDANGRLSFERHMERVNAVVACPNAD